MDDASFQTYHTADNNQIIYVCPVSYQDVDRRNIYDHARERVTRKIFDAQQYLEKYPYLKETVGIDPDMLWEYYETIGFPLNFQ